MALPILLALAIAATLAMRKDPPVGPDSTDSPTIPAVGPDWPLDAIPAETPRVADENPFGDPLGTGNGLADVIASWAGAITTMEGSKIPGNPGNIEDASGNFLTNASLPGDLTAKINKYPSWTIQQAMARWLGKPGFPPTDYSTDNQGNPVAYAKFVVNRMNADLGTAYTVDTRLEDLGRW